MGKTDLIIDVLPPVRSPGLARMRIRSDLAPLDSQDCRKLRRALAYTAKTVISTLANNGDIYLPCRVTLSIEVAHG